MKNRYLLFVLFTILSIFVVNAQDVLMESFEDEFPPEGWTITESLLQLDTNTGTNNPAGYDAYHGDVVAFFNCYSVATGNSASLTTPVFDAMDTNTVFSFAMFRDNDYFSKDDRIDVFISTNNGATWTLVESFSRYSSEGCFWDIKRVPITNGRSNTLARIVCTSDYGNDVHIDYVRVYLKNERDVKMVNLTPSYVPHGVSVKPKISITNAGFHLEDNWEITLTDGVSYLSTKSGGDLAIGDTLVVEMDTWTPVNGYYELLASVWVPADDDYVNNEMAMSSLVGTNAYASRVSYPKSYQAVDITDGQTVVIAHNNIEALPVGEDYDGVRIYRIYNNNEIGIVHPNGDFESTGFVTGLNKVSGMAYDWRNNKWYLIDVDYETLAGPFYTRLLSLNMSTRTATMIGEGNSSVGYLRGLTCADDGYLYSISETSSYLVKINPSNASAVGVGHSGLNLSHAQDLAFDRYNTMMLYSIAFDLNDDKAKFGTYNMSTGAFTVIKDYGSAQYTTLCITQPDYLLPYVFNVTFTVKNSHDEIIEGAYIEIPPVVQETDETGKTTFALENGSYDFRVVKEGYFTFTDMLVVEGASKQVPITLYIDKTDVKDPSDESIQLYPNPSDGNVNIVAPIGSVVSIIDITGRTLSSNQLMNGNLQLKLSSGIYFVEIKHDEGVSIRKLIVK